MPAFDIYEVEAFGNGLPFTGNPAAVVPLAAALEPALMQAIAAANNLSETAFLIPEGTGRRIRWFTPAVEVPLCGHATLAAAFVAMTLIEPGLERVDFQSASGLLSVARAGETFTLDFPERATLARPWPPALARALGGAPAETFETEGNWLGLWPDWREVASLAPDMGLLKRAAEGRGVIVTAAGGPEGADFSSRFFAPAHGIDEDPVTGSAHCSLAPFWARRLGRDGLAARQLSARGGYLRTTLSGGRVRIAGGCRLYLTGRITV